MTADNRKLLSRLTEADFRQSCCWEVLPDEHEDDAWVRPFGLRTGKHFCVMAAEATLANGRMCRAFVHIAHYGKALEIGPLTIFYGDEQLRIDASNPAFGYRPSAEERDVLPLRWTMAQCLEGESVPRKGSASASALTRLFKQLGHQWRMMAVQRHSYVP